MFQETEAKTIRKIEGTFEGLPYRGPAIDLKDTDRIEAILKLNTKIYVRRFDLSQEDDLKEYERICQLIVEGQAQLSYELKQYSKTDKNWVILIRWIELWYSPRGEDKKL